MKRLFSILIIALFSLSMYAQVPYLGGTMGKEHIYGYAQYKVIPQSSKMSFYCSAAIGVLDWMDLDANFNSGDMTLGLGFRMGHKVNDYFKFAVQPMVNFDLNNKFTPAYVNTGIFMNGKIGAGFWWLSNTWYSEYFNDRYVEEWLYACYTYKWFTITVGPTCEFVHDRKPDLAVGLWFNVWKNLYIYAQGGNMCLNAGDAKLTIGCDYTF